MERLSDAIRQKHARGNRCEEIDAAIAALVARKVIEIDGYLLSPVSSTTVEDRRRPAAQVRGGASILPESTIREMNLEGLNSACILARAVLETGCLMLYLSHLVRHAVSDPASADFDKLHGFAFDTLVGSGKKAKTFIFMEGHTVTNILTIMEKLDKDLGTPFLGFYEGLSEHSHPNAHGMALTYVETHKACVTTYTDQKPGRVDASMSLAISALTSALQIADMANQHWDEDRIAFILSRRRGFMKRGHGHRTFRIRFLDELMDRSQQRFGMLRPTLRYRRESPGTAPVGCLQNRGPFLRSRCRLEVAV